MELLKFIPLYAVMVTTVAGRRRMMTEADIKHFTRQHFRILSKNSREGPIMCARLAKEPYFGVEMLLGQTWRIYYTWNLDSQNHCVDMRFRNATPSIVNRIHHDMSEYLKTEPQWDAPSVLVRMGRGKHEMLLFTDQGSAGRFQGVPNLIQDRNFPKTTSVPLLNFHLKLMNAGKYLLMADCQIGVTTLSADRKNIPYRAEIANIAKNLDFGPGLQACLSDKNKDEITLRK